MPSDRNAPCHCGSGRKYKQCCLARDELFDLDRRVQAALDRGEDATALELARRLFARGRPVSEDPAVRRLLVQSLDSFVGMLEAAGQQREARQVMAEMAVLDPVIRGWRLAKAGLEKIKAGDREAGLELVRAAVAEDESDPWRWEGLAKALMYLRRLPEAQDAVGRGLLAADRAPDAVRQRDGDVRGYLHELAMQGHYWQADPEAAEAALVSAMQYDGGGDDSIESMIRLWLAAGHPERAERWVAHLPPGDGARWFRGLQACAAGRWPDARRLWRRLMQQTPMDDMLDTVWVEMQLLAGDRAAAEQYLEEMRPGAGESVDRTFYLDLARGLRPAPHPDPVLNWLAGLCLDRPDAAAGGRGPAGMVLDRFLRDGVTEGHAAARRAYGRYGMDLVTGLVAAMAGPRGMHRQLAEVCVRELADHEPVRAELHRLYRDPARPAGARGMAYMLLSRAGDAPAEELPPDLVQAAMHMHAEDMAELVAFSEYETAGRKVLMKAPAELRQLVLAALPAPGHPAALAFHAWLAQEGKPAALRRAADQRLRQGLGGKAEPGPWLEQARGLARALDPEAAVPLFELGTRLLPARDPLRPLALWQWAMALLEAAEPDDARPLLRRVIRAQPGSFWAHRAEAYLDGMRAARLTGGMMVGVRADAVGHALRPVGQKLRQPGLAAMALDLRNAYLAVADQLPPHLDQPAAWAAALAAVAMALDDWSGLGPVPSWAPPLRRTVRAAAAPETAARAVAAEVWRVLSPAQHPDWIAAVLDWDDGLLDGDDDGDDPDDDPFGGSEGR